MTTDRKAQLRALIIASGLPVTQYARDILLREPRTAYRWLKGDSPIPQAVTRWMDRQYTTATPSAHPHDAEAAHNA